MKRISCFCLLVTLALWAAPAVRAQDAATEERLKQLSGRLDDFAATQEVLRSKIADLTREMASLREQIGKPTPNYAGAEDLKQVANAVKEIDRKRLEDYEKIRQQLEKLGKTLSAPSPSSRKISSTPPSTGDPTSAADVPSKVFEHVIESGETLSAIVAAYKEKNIKVTVPQIIKANPGLNPNNLPVGKKIVIPAPPGTTP